MPLLKLYNSNDAIIGLWKMSNDEFDDCADEYLKKASREAKEMFKSNMRQLEYVCERALLREMIGNEVEIFHNEDGKPMLKGNYNISISHTRGYVAIILSEKKEVGIDIEYVSDRVKKIARHFMRSDEVANNIDSLLIHWCAKEATYKLFSSEHLDFQSIKVEIGEHVRATNMRNGKTAEINVESTPDYVLAFAI